MAKLDKYSIVLADTVSISSQGPYILSNRLSSEPDSVIFDLGGSDEEEGDAEDDGDAEIIAQGTAAAADTADVRLRAVV